MNLAQLRQRRPPQNEDEILKMQKSNVSNRFVWRHNRNFWWNNISCVSSINEKYTKPRTIELLWTFASSISSFYFAVIGCFFFLFSFSLFCNIFSYFLVCDHPNFMWATRKSVLLKIKNTFMCRTSCHWYECRIRPFMNHDYISIMQTLFGLFFSWLRIFTRRITLPNI